MKAGCLAAVETWTLLSGYGASCLDVTRFCKLACSRCIVQHSFAPVWFSESRFRIRQFQFPCLSFPIQVSESAGCSFRIRVSESDGFRLRVSESAGLVSESEFPNPRACYPSQASFRIRVSESARDL